MRQLATLILLFTSISSFAQKEYAPEFLIPYNNNGKWGWCDTLGKIIVEPQFQEVTFFDYKGRGVATVVEADVKTKFGENRYCYPNGLVVPENCILYSETYNYEDEKGRWFIVKGENSKIGIFESLEKKMVVQPEWDIEEHAYDLGANIYLKKNSEKVYYRFNKVTSQLSKTTIDSLFYMTDPESSGTEYYTSSNFFFRYTNGQITKLVDGKEIVLTPEQKKRLFSSADDLSYGVALSPGSEDYFDSKGKTYDSQSKMMDTSTCMIGVIQFNWETLEGLRQYPVIRENGKIGVYDDHGILILPFVYDKIKLQNNNREALLFSGNKVGLKLFLTTYPTIEPKYENIAYNRRLKVNSGWSFQLYKVSIDGKSGLIGENGIEYFHFD